MPKRSYGQMSSFGRQSYAKRRRAPAVRRARRRGYYRVPGRTAGALVYSPETKYFDATKAATAFVATAASWAGSELDPAANSLFTPTPGSGINNRVGRKVALQKLKIKGLLTFVKESGQTSVSTPPTVRLVLYQDKQTNGAQAQGEEVLQSAGTGAVANQLMTFQNLANFGRFRVLKDKVYTFKFPVSANDAAATTISNVMSEIPFKYTIRFRKPVLVHFNAVDGGSISDVVDNSFHLIGMSTDTGTNITYESRCVFTDI